MWTRIWGLLCLSACVAACSENSDPSVPTTDATVPIQMDMSAAATDMQLALDQSITADGAIPSPTDMSTDMAVQIDAEVNSDMALECTDNCIEDTLTWGRIGGRTPYDVVYTLSPCRNQVIQINSFSAVDPDALRCERTAPGCGSEARITLPEVLIQLAAVLGSNAFDFDAVYGVDSRPVDGQVFSIVFRGQELLLGDPCEGSVSECTNPPPEVIELADLLWDFGRAMENTEPSCANIRDEL